MLRSFHLRSTPDACPKVRHAARDLPLAPWRKIVVAGPWLSDGSGRNRRAAPPIDAQAHHRNPMTDLVGLSATTGQGTDRVGGSYDPVLIQRRHLRPC